MFGKAAMTGKGTQMKMHLRVFLALGALSLVSISHPAIAGIIYSENFNTQSAFEGSSVPAANYSEAWTPTDWYTINNAQGWAFSTGGYYATDGTTTQGAVLLNENGSSTSPEAVYSLTGLTVGQTYRVSFNYWGDNQSSGNWLLTGWANGSQVYSEPGHDVGAQTNYPGHDGSYTFVASGMTESIGFGQAGSTNGASPIIDNVSVSTVPLPAALPLLLSGLAALGALSRRRKLANLSAA